MAVSGEGLGGPGAGEAGVLAPSGLQPGVPWTR